MFGVRCRILGMWNVQDVRSLRYEIWDDVRDVRCSRFGVFGMRDVWNMGCLEYGVFRIRDIQDLGYLGYRLLGMLDVQDVDCSRCGMFGMWNLLNVRFLRCGMFGVRNDGMRDAQCLPGCGMLIYKFDLMSLLFAVSHFR